MTKSLKRKKTVFKIAEVVAFRPAYKALRKLYPAPLVVRRFEETYNRHTGWVVKVHLTIEGKDIGAYDASQLFRMRRFPTMFVDLETRERLNQGITWQVSELVTLWHPSFSIVVENIVAVVVEVSKSGWAKIDLLEQVWFRPDGYERTKGRRRCVIKSLQNEVKSRAELEHKLERETKNLDWIETNRSEFEGLAVARALLKRRRLPEFRKPWDAA
jgi:hypothetical protein